MALTTNQREWVVYTLKFLNAFNMLSLIKTEDAISSTLEKRLGLLVVTYDCNSAADTK